MMLQSTHFQIILMMQVLLLAACGSRSFSGDGQKKEGKKTEANAEQPVQQEVPQENNEQVSLADAEQILASDGLTAEDQKLLGCLNEWGSIPFSKEQLSGYRKLQSRSEGFSSGAIKDTKKTDEPRLVLVKASSVGFSGVTLELFNPNGWYCLDIENVGFSSAKILVHCEAEIAGNNTTNTGFSSTQETRVGC